MKAQDRLALVITLSVPLTLFAIIIGIVFLASEGKEIPPILEDLCKIIGGAFIGYVGGVASAYFG